MTRPVATTGPGQPALARRPAGLLVMLAVGAVLAALSASWIVGVARGDHRSTDFTALYTGATVLHEHGGHAVYDLATQAQVQDGLLDGASFDDGVRAYVNPPQVTVGLLPLVHLRMADAYLAWLAVNVALLVAAALALRPLARDWANAERTLLVLGAVGSVPFAALLAQGTLSAVVLLGTVLVARGLLDGGGAGRPSVGPDLLAGVGLVLVAVKPQNVVLLVVLVLALRRWRVLAWAAAAGAPVAAAATARMGGPAVWADYLSLLRSYGSINDRYGVSASGMWNVRGILVRLLHAGDSGTAATVVSVAVPLALLVGAVAVARCGRAVVRGSLPLGAAIAATVLLGAALSPHAHPHDSIVVVLAVVLARGVLPAGAARRWADRVAVLLPPFTLFAGWQTRTVLGNLPAVAWIALATGIVLAAGAPQPSRARTTRTARIRVATVRRPRAAS